MRIADEEIERDFKHGMIKADPLADEYADPERSKRNAHQRDYIAKNREKYNAYQREYRAKMKAKYPDRWNAYQREYRARIKAMYRAG